MTMEASQRTHKRHILSDTTSMSRKKVRTCMTCAEAGTSGGCSICSRISASYRAQSRVLILKLENFETPESLGITALFIDEAEDRYTYEPSAAALHDLLDLRCAEWVVPTEAPKPARVALQIEYREEGKWIAGTVDVEIVIE